MKALKESSNLILFACFMSIASYSPSAHADSMIRENDFGFFKEAIEVSSYQCSTCEGGHFLGDGYKGKLFRVYCNGNSLKYRVVIGNKYLCVEPWDTKNQKCE